MVRHARPHVSRFWYFQNRKVIGISMAMFGIIYAIGLVFTVILTETFETSTIGLLVMWVILFCVALLVTLASVITSHSRVTKLMNEKEHFVHSGNVGMFLFLFALSIVIFSLPLTLTSYPKPLMFLFGVGGVLLLTYALISAIFGYKYHEVGIAALLILISFGIGFFTLIPKFYTNPPILTQLSFLLEATTIVAVFTITGLAMLNNATNEFVKEFKIANKLKD